MSLRFIRRRLARDVHDGRPEEVLRGHEEDGEQETGQGDAEAKGKIIYSSYSSQKKNLH